MGAKVNVTCLVFVIQCFYVAVRSCLCHSQEFKCKLVVGGADTRIIVWKYASVTVLMEICIC